MIVGSQKCSSKCWLILDTSTVARGFRRRLKLWRDKMAGQVMLGSGYWSLGRNE